MMMMKVNEKKNVLDVKKFFDDIYTMTRGGRDWKAMEPPPTFSPLRSESAPHSNSQLVQHHSVFYRY